MAPRRQQAPPGDGAVPPRPDRAMPSVYLAGPDVFMPDPAARAGQLRTICERYGLSAIWPLDPLPGAPPSRGDAPAIAACNEAHIRRADAILANLSPFRGPSADPGTVYEVGFGRALGKLVFGYSTVALDLAARVRALPGSTAAWDAAGLTIEDFGLAENLMVVCGIQSSGGFVLAEAAADDLAVFTRCVARAAAVLARAGA